MSVKSFVEGQLVPRKKKKSGVPEAVPEAVPQAPQKPSGQNTAGQIEVIRNQDTGKISGWTDPEGNTFFGNAEDLDSFIKSQSPEPTPPGTVEMADAQRQRDFQAATRGVDLTQTNPNLQTNPPENPTTLRDQLPTGSDIAAGAGAAGAGELAVASRVGVAALGLGTAPLSAPAAASFVAGAFVIGTYTSMSIAARKNINVQKGTLAENRGNLKFWTASVNAGIDAEGAYEEFNNQLEAINEAYWRLKFSDTIKNKLLAQSPVVELAKFDDFYAPGGDWDIAVREMTLARNFPNKEAGLLALQQMAANREQGEFQQ